MKPITVKKSSLFKFAIVLLSLLLVVATSVAVSYGIKYSQSQADLQNLGETNAQNEALISDKNQKLEEYESVIEQNSSEKQSYEEQLSQEQEEYQSEVDKLKKEIEKLKKELAAKMATTTTKKVTTTATANNSQPVVQPETNYVPTSEKTVYLTFDDGPSYYTPEILDILDRYGVKATFFVINGRYNSTMKDIVDRGHQIGLHTYSHDYSKIYSSDEAYFKDLQKIHDVVKEQTGVDATVMRFPGGSSNTVSKNYSKGIMTRITKAVGLKGYVYFDWNCSNGDADGANTVEKQLSFCKQYPKSASRVVVLMHDTKKTTMEALPKIIEYYQSQGMKFGVLTPEVKPIRHNVLN